MDASVVAPGDGLAKPVRFLEPAGVGIGRTGAFLGGLVGRLDLRGHLPHYVGKSMASLFFHPVNSLIGSGGGMELELVACVGCSGAGLGPACGQTQLVCDCWWSWLQWASLQASLPSLLRRAWRCLAGIWGAAGALVGVFGAGGPGLGKSSSEELGSLGGRGVGNLPFKGSFGLGRLGVAGDGDLVGGGWNGSYSVEAAGLWTSSKLAMSFMGAPPWATCAGCAWSRLVGASVALNAVVAESVVSELEEWTSVMAELEN